jgi:hypothetical protein
MAFGRRLGWRPEGLERHFQVGYNYHGRAVDNHSFCREAAPYVRDGFVGFAVDGLRDERPDQRVR